MPATEMTEVGAARDIDYKKPSSDATSSNSQAKSNNSQAKDNNGVQIDPELALGQQITVHKRTNKLGWKKLTICLIVEAIALGSLSIPKAFATVGMIPGIILTVGLGLIAIYTSYVVGQVKMRHPHVAHYADAVKLIWGRFGYELTGVMFALFLILLVGSHALTGTIAWIRIVDSPGVCAVIFSIVSAIILFLLALPPTFHDFAWLGYVDFASIIIAILITMIDTGISAHSAPGGLSGVDWSLWPPPDTTLYDAFLQTTNIVFAYSFAVCQFSFMNEMHTPQDYVKSIWALGLIEIFIYTLTGAIIYSFVGSSVSSPALLSSNFTVSRVAFGIALPVIFISGAINGTVVGKYILDRAFPESEISQINTKRGWTIWIGLIGVITIIGWLIAEAIPFFSALLGIISSLFISGFSFYFPALFWFMLIKEGKWNKSWKYVALSITNAACLVIGIAILGLGTYASVQDIINEYTSGSVRGSFSCSQSGYS